MCSSATSSPNVSSAHKESNFGTQEEKSNSGSPMETLMSSDLPECPFSDDPGADNVVEEPINLDHLKDPPIVIDSETSSVCICSYACMI